MSVCSDNVGGTSIRIMARPSQNESLHNYYLAVSHDSAPQISMIFFIGQNREQALRRFEVSRENALAALAYESASWCEEIY